MGIMTFTPELLNASDEKVNLVMIAGPVSDLIEACIEDQVGMFEEHFYENTGGLVEQYCQDNNLDFWDEVSYDFAAMFHKLWPVVADLLETALPDVFGEHGPVKVSSYDPSVSRPPTGLWGQECEVAMFTWNIDGAKLYDIARDELGTVEIPDGHNISGFIRTCEDSYWAQCKVLEALVPDEFWYTILDEIASAYILDDMVSFGRLEELV